MAVSLAVGPQAGLALLDEIESAGTLQQYGPFHLARADIFRRLGRAANAAKYYRPALSFAQNDQVRRFIEQRLRDGGR